MVHHSCLAKCQQTLRNLHLHFQADTRLIFLICCLCRCHSTTSQTQDRLLFQTDTFSALGCCCRSVCSCPLSYSILGRCSETNCRLVNKIRLYRFCFRHKAGFLYNSPTLNFVRIFCETTLPVFRQAYGDMCRT